MSEPNARRREGGWEILGWIFALLAVAYAFAIHHGIGPIPLTASLDWYEPRGYLQSWDWLAWAFEPSRRVFLVFTLPALALTVAVFLTGGSGVARALALSSLVAVLLFCFYGEVATRVWQFFHWRASAVLALMALCVGFAMAAPFLAASWLRMSWPLRLAVYLPICLGVLALIRNATGTDLTLRFALSPWPAVPVFGIEVGALFVMVWMLGAALGVAGIAWARTRGVAAIAGGVALGIAVPCGLLLLGAWLSMLPFGVGRGTLVTVAVACCLAILLSGTLGVRGRADALRQRAVHLAVGAALIAVPLLSGEAWARWDYYRTREHRAGELIDAMNRYYADEEIYPDELDELVTGNYLDELPEPAIGFGFLYDGSFRYRSFGTSYILEFPAPRWVECAYSPPYDDEEEEEEEEELEAWERAEYAASGEDGESLEGAWSCPSKPPQLW